MQQINLYSAEFQPKRQWATLSSCVYLCAAIFAIGALIGGVQRWQSQQLRSEENTLQAQVDSEQSSMEADQATLAARQTSPELGLALQQRNAEEAAKNELLKALQTGALSGQQGYTPVLVSLARNTLEGLWLTAIDINAGDVNLSGSTRKADFVPIYIDKIVRDKGFGPREYRSLNMQSDATGLLNFELRGHRDKGDSQ